MNSNPQRVLELMSKNQEIVNVNDSCEKQGLKGCSYSNGYFIDGEKNIYKYGDGTFLWDKEKTDSRRQQQQEKPQQQGGKEKKGALTPDDY